MSKKEVPSKKTLRLSKELEAHFEIRGYLGDGSTARVFELYCKKKTSYCRKRQTVALKVAKTPNDSRNIRNEFMQLRSLEHPNIIKVFELVDCIGDRGKKVSGFIMEHCTGGSLFLHVQKNKVSESLAFTWFSQIAGAVKYLHDNGICHRYLCTSNVLISSPHRRTPKIIDFGTYCDVDYDAQTVILSGDGEGAPEMKAEDRYDPRHVDIYSMGTILHSLLCFPPNGFLLPLEKVSPKCNALLATLLHQEGKNRPTVHQILNSDWFSLMGSLSLSSSSSLSLSSWSLSSSADSTAPTTTVTAIESLSSSESADPSHILLADGQDRAAETDLIEEDAELPSEQDLELQRIQKEQFEEESKKSERQLNFLKRINWTYLADTSKEIMNLQSLLFLYSVDRLRPENKHKEAIALLKNVFMVIKKQEKLLSKAMKLAAIHSYDISAWTPQYEESLRLFEPLHKKLIAEIITEQFEIENAPFNTGILCSSLEVVDRAIQFYLLQSEREHDLARKHRYESKVTGFWRWRTLASLIDPLYSSLKEVL